MDLDLPEEGGSWVHVHPARTPGGVAKPQALGTDRPRSPDRSGRSRDRRGALWKIRLEFAWSVSGPLLLGHSAHFGLGQFVPVED